MKYLNPYMLEWAYVYIIDVVLWFYDVEVFIEVPNLSGHIKLCTT